MPQLTIRNVPESVVRALRIRATRNGRSAESEVRTILAQVLCAETSDFWARADACRASIRRQASDSGVLQREMRDER